MLLSASLIVSCHHLGRLRTNHVLFIFQISILIHRTVCSNVQMHMYNLKTKPRVIASVFWRYFFFFQWRWGGRKDVSVSWLVLRAVNFPASKAQWAASTRKPKWKNGCLQDVMKIKNKQMGLGGKGALALQSFAISDFANCSAVSFDLCFSIILPGDISGLLLPSQIPLLGY